MTTEVRQVTQLGDAARDSNLLEAFDRHQSIIVSVGVFTPCTKKVGVFTPCTKKCTGV